MLLSKLRKQWLLRHVLHWCRGCIAACYRYLNFTEQQGLGSAQAHASLLTARPHPCHTAAARLQQQEGDRRAAAAAEEAREFEALQQMYGYSDKVWCCSYPSN